MNKRFLDNSLDLSPRKKKKNTNIVDLLYKFINKHTKYLHIDGAQGPIYGELTQSSISKILDYLVSHCQLGENSVFMDIGSGLGKPNLHAATITNIKYSIGIELVDSRWWHSMHLLAHIADSYHLNNIAQKTFFMHGDINNFQSLDGISHIYIFNCGIPTKTMNYIATKIRNSNVAYITCFSNMYNMFVLGFNVSLIHKIQTTMSGSAERHTCYIYKNNSHNSIIKQDFHFVKSNTILNYAPTNRKPLSYTNGKNIFINKPHLYFSWIKEQTLAE
jgi:hypothetical protein